MANGQVKLAVPHINNGMYMVSVVVDGLAKTEHFH